MLTLHLNLSIFNNKIICAVFQPTSLCVIDFSPPSHLGLEPNVSNSCFFFQTISFNYKTNFDCHTIRIRKKFGKKRLVCANFFAEINKRFDVRFILHLKHFQNRRNFIKIKLNQA